MLHVYDIESYNGLFLDISYDIITKEWYIFEISKFKNNLYSLVKHLEARSGKYDISFNGISYDSQVLQFIMDNYHNWVELNNLQIVSLIKKFSNRVIDDTKYGLFPPYREEQIDIKQIDLFKIHHYDNENRRTSLKWIQFSMDFHTVEESPIPFDREEFTEDDILECINYCKNDIESTYLFYLFTIGQTEHEEYKGKNKIQDRYDLIEELKFPSKAISWSDVKLGDEINKKVYKELSNLTDRQVYDLKKTRRTTAGFTYGQCIPDYVTFVTPAFQSFFERMKPVKVNLNDKKIAYPFSYNGTTYMIAKGGIHSTERNRITIPLDNEDCRDADIGGQYPNSIIKRSLFPSHLGKKWLVGYTGTRDRRIGFKKTLKKFDEKSIEYRKAKGLSETYKLALNGGGFGKTNERSNWQYDPFVHFRCNIGNQFEILMLIEMLETNGIHVISANTDGIVCLFDKNKSDLYYSICNGWEEIVGNAEQGKLEFKDYKKLIQTSVNDYIAIPVESEKDQKIKKKGDFLTESELNKNKSRRIIPLALENYFVKGIPVEETISKHQNIYDFCIGVKASKDYHYETVDKFNQREVYHRMIRYFVSTNGKKLLKIKNPDSEADGNEVTNCEAGGWKCTIANIINKEVKIEDYNINYSYYIDKASEIVRALEAGIQKKGKKIYRNPDQINMFS